MNGEHQGVAALRGKIANGAEDRLGRALSDLLESPVVSGAIGRAFDAREKAAQAQELAMGALNLPSAADIERLTRRLRSLSQRLEGVEDGVSRIDRGNVQRLTAIEEQLKAIAAKVDALAGDSEGAGGRRPAPARPAARSAAAPVKRAAAKAPGTPSRARTSRAKPKQ
jgi:hypothetical protein